MVQRDIGSPVAPPDKEEAGSSVSYFRDPTACLSGRVSLGSHDYLGPFARVEALEPFGVELSDRVNLQDHAGVHATGCDTIVGDRTSIAHGAHVRNCNVGSLVFIGFNARVEDSVIEDGAMVLHGARVQGVTIPKDRIVPPGSVITDAAQIGELPSVTEADILFKEEVIDVNVELAEGYARLAGENGKASVEGVSSNPVTSWSPQSVRPALDDNVHVSPGARVIGNTQISEGSAIGAGASLRGDEGSPILIGPRARIGRHVTLHSLKHQTIQIGSDFVAGDHTVLHGALSIGYGVTVDEQAVVFKSVLGNRAHVGRGAIVIGVRLADGTRIPDGFHVLDQVTADRFNESALERHV